jgi:hypothetical protein
MTNIKILLISLVLSSCAATPNGPDVKSKYIVTTFDSAGEVKKEYFIDDYEQDNDGVTWTESGKKMRASGSFKIERVNP